MTPARAAPAPNGRASAAPGRAGKLAAELPELVPQAHGGALLSGGIPGHRGGTGRPTNALLNFLESVRSDPEAQQLLANIARGRTFTKIVEEPARKGRKRRVIKATALIDVAQAFVVYKWVVERLDGRTKPSPEELEGLGGAGTPTPIVQLLPGGGVRVLYPPGAE